VGAALATIFSEFSLLFPFYYSVRRHVGRVPWFRVFGPPLLSTALMGLATYGLVLAGVNVWLAVAGGLVVYIVGLMLTGAMRGEDMATVLRALPIGPLRRLVAAG
jgi:O-antigen/teichoic acid export membrane protein